MRIFFSLLLAALLAFISFEGYTVARQHARLEATLSASIAESLKLSQENEQYQRQVQFNSHDENLIKEAQTKYSVKKEGETMLILIPADTTTST